MIRLEQVVGVLFRQYSVQELGWIGRIKSGLPDVQKSIQLKAAEEFFFNDMHEIMIHLLQPVPIASNAAINNC